MPDHNKKTSGAIRDQIKSQQFHGNFTDAFINFLTINRTAINTLLTKNTVTERFSPLTTPGVLCPHIVGRDSSMTTICRVSLQTHRVNYRGFWGA